MKDLTVLGLFNLLPDNLENAETFTDGLINEVLEEGNLYASEIMLKAKIVKDALDKVIKMPAIKYFLSKEVTDKETQFSGFKIRETQRTKYDFSVCNDSNYMELMSKKGTLDKAIKAREKFLKSVPEEGTVSLETGEVIEVAAPTHQTIYSVIINKKKK